jgi:hypothetical protein
VQQGGQAQQYQHCGGSHYVSARSAVLERNNTRLSLAWRCAATEAAAPPV